MNTKTQGYESKSRCIVMRVIQEGLHANRSSPIVLTLGPIHTGCDNHILVHLSINIPIVHYLGKGLHVNFILPMT